MEKQKTLKKTAQLSGIALHTGVRAMLKINPAPSGTGIVFRRVDLPGAPEVRALASRVVDARRGTTIASERAVVYTVEHIMAALHAHGVDNAVVDMDGQEPPIADGSALPYFAMIAEAGLEEQNAAAEYWTAREIIAIEEGETKLVLLPSDDFRITCVTSFPGAPVETQFLSMKVTPESFAAELAPARTFVNFRDLEQLIAMGLVKGGSLDSAAVIHNGAVICKEELRYRDEIVRHKILDLVGDTYLAGRRVKADIIAIKPGHYVNVKLALAMLAQQGCRNGGEAGS